ncbi:DnaJ subfamily b member 14-like protein [Trifolium pratense]|uniref:DnaJ subfamily b member 14-like protein n=1 Tax=Trifolium pratense TaxID=57577 RepID=A0A2K3NRS7_TRIPR|nr:DnaJ subfamily b member 14-like protein [Trifolium pratense]
MASTTTPSPQILLFNPILGNIKTIKGVRFFRITKSTNSHYSLQVHASKDSQGPQKAPSGVDTRIHWENEDEGWIGGSTKQKQTNEDVKQPKKLLGEDFADLLSFQGSHYE